MNPDVLTVRQWQELYRAGAFESDRQEALDWAGWNDFYDPLNDRGLRNLCKLVMSITHPFVLDNYHVYFLHHTPGVRIYREGDHRYSYTSFQGGRQRMVVAADSLEKVPPGFQAGDAVPVGGLYVFSQKDTGKGIEINDINKKKLKKRSRRWSVE